MIRCSAKRSAHRTRWRCRMACPWCGSGRSVARSWSACAGLTSCPRCSIGSRCVWRQALLLREVRRGSPTAWPSECRPPIQDWTWSARIRLHSAFGSAEEEAADVALINAARPDYVWVGLGAPKQDLWAARHRPGLDAAVRARRWCGLRFPQWRAESCASLDAATWARVAVPIGRRAATAGASVPRDEHAIRGLAGAQTRWSGGALGSGDLADARRRSDRRGQRPSAQASPGSSLRMIMRSSHGTTGRCTRGRAGRGIELGLGAGRELPQAGHPRLHRQRRRCHVVGWRPRCGSGGRGPTRLISPRSTFRAGAARRGSSRAGTARPP